MRNSYLKTLIFGAAMLLVGGQSFAQTPQADLDPMTYAKSVHIKSLHTQKLTSKSSRRQSSTSSSANYFTHNYGTETTIPTKISDELTAKYGSPKTGRGDLKVWEVKNSQRRNVTIMIGSNSNGHQELIIDQRSPQRQTRKIPPKTFVSPRSAPPARTLSQERD